MQDTGKAAGKARGNAEVRNAEVKGKQNGELQGNCF
jgi:hypothetical protein